MESMLLESVRFFIVSGGIQFVSHLVHHVKMWTWKVERDFIKCPKNLYYNIKYKYKHRQLQLTEYTIQQNCLRLVR